MASYDVLHVDNNSSGSYPSEEFSLLNEVGDAIFPNGSVSNVKYDFTNMHSTLNDTASDPNSEVSLQLTKLISENVSLKEALDKNNLMMKEQLSTIPAWRDLMITKAQQQQQKLLGTEEKVSFLEKENNNLQKKLHQLLEEMCPKEDAKDFCTKCETLESTLSSLFREKDFIEKDRSIVCSELDNFHKNLEQNLIVICQHLNATLKNKRNEKEKNLLKTFINLLKYKIAALNGSFCATVQTDEETGYEIVHQLENKEESVEECSQTSMETFKKIEDLKKILAMKDEELDLLRKEKNQLSEKVKVYDLKLQELERTSKKQFELLSDKLQCESSVSEKYKERCEILQQQNEEYQCKLEKSLMSDNHNIQELRQEISNLQEILKIEQRSNQRDKEELKEVSNSYKKLQEDYDRVTQLLEVVSRDEKEKIEKLQTLNINNEKSYIEQIDHLTASLLEVQEQLSESNAEVREMKEKLSTIEESETLPILKEQIEVYKREFTNTEAAYKSAQQEVERLTNELKRHQENPDSDSRNSSPASSRRNASGHENEQKYECPLCQNTFANLRAAENHVHRCLDNKNSPSTF